MDETEEIPVPEGATLSLTDLWSRSERNKRRSRLALVLALVAVVVMAVGMPLGVVLVVQQTKISDLVARVEEGQRIDRCETQRIGEYLATFSDYLGVTPGDPFRRELDEHLRHVAEQLRNHSRVCESMPTAPVSTTTTTTTTTTLPEAPPEVPAAPAPRQTSVAPTPQPAPAPAAVQLAPETQPGKRLAKGQDR